MSKGLERKRRIFFGTRKVYEYAWRHEAEADPGAIIVKTKWVDHNKGTRTCPIIRSRLCAMEFNNQELAEMFAPTPPLMATRWLVSRWRAEEDKDRGYIEP